MVDVTQEVIDSGRDAIASEDAFRKFQIINKCL